MEFYVILGAYPVLSKNEEGDWERERERERHAVRNLLWNCEAHGRPRKDSFAQAVRYHHSARHLSVSIVLVYAAPPR
jgi:hypothetical protein